MSDVLSISRLPSWVALIVLMFPLILLVSFLQGIFANGLFGLFELAFNVVVLFLCLGPADTDQQIDEYLHTIDTGDQEKRFDAAAALCEKTPESDIRLQAEQVVSAIFIASHRRVFACLFWFVFLGPLGAVFYRLIEQNTWIKFRDDSAEQIKQKSLILLGYLEWIPTRISILAFMISGHFEGAFAGYRKATNDLVDIDETNQGILQLGGQGAIQFEAVETEAQATDQVRKSRGLVLRSLVVWLVISLVLTWV